MKKLIAALIALPVTAVHAQKLVNNFEDIQFWAGTGTNRAALVIEWPDDAAPKSVAWGYRWNGVATAQDMMFALAGILSGGPSAALNSDPRLELVLTYYGQGLNDYFIDKIFFDQSELGGGWTALKREMPGWDGVDFNALYFRYGTASWSSLPFISSQFGPAGLPLQNGAWVGWVYANGLQTNLSFAQPYAAPGASVPAFEKPSTTIRWTNGAAVVSFMSFSNCSYQLSYSGSLGSSWTNEPLLRSGNGAEISITNPVLAGTTQRFYRVIVTR